MQWNCTGSNQITVSDTFTRNKNCMKAFKILAFILLPLLSECKKEKAVESIVTLPECVQEKIEAFKKAPESARILKILKPNDPLIWMVDSLIDTGENVWNLNCELVCIADCECGSWTQPMLCDSSFLDFPKEVIWQK